MKHDHEGEVNHTLEIPEEVKIGISRVKKHLRDNRMTYLAGVGCLATGYFLRRPSVQISAPSIAPVFNNTPVIAPVMNNTQVNNFGGPLTKMVKCLETGEIWETVTDTAESAGVGIQKMSRHLNGHKDHVNGLHYKIIGLGTAA